MIKIQRLNQDNSWFLQIGEMRLLVDPWLEGAEVDFFPWFNTQWHRTEPLAYQALPEYDAVLITQKYPDHYHKQTLKRLQPERIIAPASIRKSLQKLLPNTSVFALSKINPLMYLNGIKFLFMSTSRKIDPIYDALLLDDGEQSIFLATHGFHPTSGQVKEMKNASPCTLLITPFNLYELPAVLGGIVSPGIENVEKLVNILNPKHVLATHDEDKPAKGLVSKFARITRSESAENLQKLPFLANRYRDITDYKITTLA